MKCVGAQWALLKKLTRDKIPEPFPGVQNLLVHPILLCHCPAGCLEGALMQWLNWISLSKIQIYTCHMPLFVREIVYLGERRTAGLFLGLARSTAGLGSRVQWDLREAGHYGTGLSLPGSALPPWDLLES